MGILRSISDTDGTVTIDEAHGHEVAYPDTLAIRKIMTSGGLFRKSTSRQNSVVPVPTAPNGDTVG